MKRWLVKPKSYPGERLALVKYNAEVWEYLSGKSTDSLPLCSWIIHLHCYSLNTIRLQPPHEPYGSQQSVIHLRGISLMVQPIPFPIVESKVERMLSVPHYFDHPEIYISVVICVEAHGG